MNRYYTLRENVLQAVSLKYRYTLTKINITILFAIIFAKSIAIYVAIL